MLPPAAVDAALAGMRDAASKWYGTAATIKYGENDREPIISAPWVRVYAKTGTAQTPPAPPVDVAEPVNVTRHVMMRICRQPR